MADERAPGRERNRSARAVLESPLSATWTPRVRERAVLVGVGPGIGEDGPRRAGGPRRVRRRRAGRARGAEPASPTPATYVGRGKLDELHRLVHANDASAR